MKVFGKLFKHRLTLFLAIAITAGILSYGLIYTITTNKERPLNSKEKCDGSCVYLRQDKASPDTIAVELGSFVQFNSADGKSHDLSLGGGGDEHSHKGKFQSGVFNADEAWRVQFNEEGSFLFHDHYNPKINVLVVVYKPGKQYKVE